MNAKTQLDVIVKGKDELSPELQRLSSQVIRFVGAVSASLAAIRIGTEPVVMAARYERELANVQKTTNFTRKEIGKLSDALLKMSTNVDISAKDLATIAAAAGQQGLGRYGVQGVVDFTDSVSRMSSVLDITAEEAGENIGKIINVFRIPLRNIENAVSSFNQVANNSTAKGEELLDVVRRIGDAAGSLRLDQAIGLAATGLDFGQSPEVVGTAYANIFANLRAKAGDFGRLLNMQTSDFINLLQKDGVEALQTVLEAMRKLRPEVQQQAVTKLFGGGRISSLLNKLLQDTTNEVMNRSLQNAAQGMREGTSAIVEQTTVLQTAQAQAQMLLNTMAAVSMKSILGDMGEGTSILAELAYSAMQFREALNSPGVQSTVNAIYQSVSDMVGGVADAVKWMASLNVNWENFITLGKYWLSLKLASYFAGLGLRATGLGKVMQDTAKAQEALDAATTKGAQTASTAQKTAASGAKASWVAQKLGLAEVEAAYRQYAASALQQEQLVRQSKQRTADLDKAIAAEASAKAAVDRARGVVAARRVDVNDNSAKIASLAKKQAAAEAAAEAGRQASIQRAMQKDADIRLQIEAAYQDRLKVIKGRGAVAARAELAAEYANQHRQADEANARSLAAVKRYWDARKASDVAGIQASIQAQQAALMAAQGRFDKAYNTLDGRQKKAGAAGSAVEGAKSLVDATAAAMVPAAAKVGILTRAVNLASLSFRTLVGVVASTGRILMSALGWIGVIMTIADALGLMERFGGILSVVADKIGLVTKADRDRAIQAETTKRQQEAEIRRLEDLAAGYDKLKDKATGSIGEGSLVALQQRLGADQQQETRQAATRDVATVIAGAEAEIEAAAIKGKAAIDGKLRAATEDLAARAKEVSLATADLDRVTARWGADNANFTAPARAFLAERQRELAAAQAKVDALNKSLSEIPAATTQAQSSIERTSQLVAGMFTDESAKAFKNFVVPIVAAETKVKELRDQYKDLAQEAATAENAGKSDAELRRAAADEALAEMTAQNSALAVMRDNLSAFIQQIVTAPGVPDNVKKSMEDLGFFATMTKEQVEGLVRALNILSGTNVPLTGATAGVAARPPATGEGTFSPKPNSGRSGESEAKKAARARLALERERIKQENALRQEQIDQQLAIEQRLYDQGLVKVSEFYDARKKLQLESNSMETEMLRAQLSEVNKEIAGAKVTSEKLRFQQQATQLKGEIAVLEERRKALQAQNDEEARRAAIEFQKLQLSTVNSLYSSLLQSGSMKDIYESKLEELRLVQRETMAKLGTELGEDLKNALDKSLQFQAYAETLQPLQAKFDVVRGSFDQFSRGLAVMYSQGIITSQEMEKAMDSSLKKTVANLKDVLAEQEKYLQSIAHLKDTAPIVWEQQVQRINDTRLSIAELNLELDRSAKSINKAMGDAITEGLANLEPTLASVKDMTLTFLLDILKTLQRGFAEVFSEQIMRAVTGPGGIGGLGGWFQGVVRGDTADVATGDAQGKSPALPLFVSQVGNPMDVADTSGKSIANPMFVHVVNQQADDAFGGDVAGGIFGIQDATGSLAKDGVDIAPESSNALISGINTGLATLGGAIGGDLGSLAALLTSLFGSLMTAMSASAAGGSIMGLFGAAHIGGKVGQLSQKRKVPISVFSGATRYHNGGVAGLKPNEVPTILEEGETVRTQAQEAALQRQLAAGAGGGTGEMSIRNILLFDQALIPQAMAGADGEKVTMSTISKNKATIRQMLK